MLRSSHLGETLWIVVLAVLLSSLLSACAAPALQAAPQPVTVFAAASLTGAFKEIGGGFTSETGIPVVFNFAGSQQLRAQLEQGADADVFAPANTMEMDTAISSGLVVTGTSQIFAHNRLAVIFPKANPGRIGVLGDLGRAGIKLVIADKAVPAGQYTLEMLDKMNEDASYGADFRARVLANVVSYEQNVKSVVSKVQLGEADAGVVYTTDVTLAASEQVGSLAVPEAFNQVATYPIARLAKSRYADAAAKFVAYVLSAKGKAVLAKHGFAVAGSK